MKRLINLYLIMLFFALSCSSDPSPSQAELRQSLAVNLPAFVEISSYSIEASQNIGTKVEPLYQSRFKAVLKIKSDTYLQAGKEGLVLFVRQHKKQSDKIEIFGKNESSLYAGKWKTNVSFDGVPLQTLGYPISMFAASKVIVKGSEDESMYYAKKELLKKERQEALRKIVAEEERIKKEEQEELRKAAEERATLSTKMNNTLAGKWKTRTNSIYTYYKDGTVTLINEKGKKWNGKWHVHDGDLIFKWKYTPNKQIYKVLFYSQNVYKLQNKKGTYTSNRIE